jgi:uncharacterized protein (UPF0332 family)
MTFDWTKYLILAKELSERANDEASLRSAISRAYYAAFCTARNRLLQEGEEIPRTGEAHNLVWEKYRESAHRGRKKIGVIGDRLRRSRNIADYEDEFPNLDRKAYETVVSTSDLLASLGALDSDKR